MSAAFVVRKICHRVSGKKRGPDKRNVNHRRRACCWEPLTGAHDGQAQSVPQQRGEQSKAIDRGVREYVAPFLFRWRLLEQQQSKLSTNGYGLLLCPCGLVAVERIKILLRLGRTHAHTQSKEDHEQTESRRGR